MDHLSDGDIEINLKELSDWKRDEKFIMRRYHFPSFIDAMAFVNHVAGIAEQTNHHPFISIDYKVVTLKLTSWHAGGLTQLDFDEAKQFDRLYKT